MFPVGWIAGWLLKKGFSDRGARSLAWAFLIGVVLIAAALGWSMLKDSIIDEHETEQRAERAENTLEQTNQANAQDAQHEAADEAATAKLEEGARNAKAANPEAAGAPVGPVSNSVHDGLRNRRERAP